MISSLCWAKIPSAGLSTSHMASLLPHSSGLLSCPCYYDAPHREKSLATCSSRLSENGFAYSSLSSLCKSRLVQNRLQLVSLVWRKRSGRRTFYCANVRIGDRGTTHREDSVSTGLPEGATLQDAEYMRMAVELAKKAMGHTSPNPMVGCVIVKNGQIVGRGFHPKAGEPHAEVFALREAGENAVGATAYVSLEPCNHTGRTPPCSQALVRARVQRVVVGTVDPNPLVGGQGVQTLRKAGIEVVVGVEQALCQAAAETFFHRIVTKKPFVTLRYTMSMDGAELGRREKQAPKAGSHYSRLLQEHDAVVVTDTCVHDNPILMSSEAGAKQPLRVLLAKSLDLPLNSHVLDTSLSPTLVITDANALEKDVQTSSEQGGEMKESTLRSRGVDVVAMNNMNLDSVLDLLYQKGFNSVLLDSPALESYLGPFSLSELGPQKLVVVISPVLVGNKGKGPGFLLENEVLKLERITTRVSEEDVIVEGYFSDPSSNNT